MLRLHSAPDGHLARIRVPGGRLRASQLQAIAKAAQIGSGTIELTSRANLQLRGLEADASHELARVLAAAQLFPSPAHDRVRNVIASPLCGRQERAHLDTDALVSELDRQLCADLTLSALPGRFLFAVDDGSGLALGHGADIALAACSERSFQLLIAERPTVATVREVDAPGLAMHAARQFLEERERTQQTGWRIAELADGPQRIGEEIGAPLAPHPARDASDPARDASAALQARGPLAPGTVWQRDGRIALTAVVRGGSLHAGEVTQLAQLSRAHSLEVRISPWRTMTVCDLSRASVSNIAEQLEACGLSVDPQAMGAQSAMTRRAA